MLIIRYAILYRFATLLITLRIVKNITDEYFITDFSSMKTSDIEKYNDNKQMYALLY